MVTNSVLFNYLSLVQEIMHWVEIDATIQDSCDCYSYNAIFPTFFLKRNAKWIH